MRFLQLILMPFRDALGAMFPMFAGRAASASTDAAKGRGPRIVKWVLHGLLLALILVGLWFLNGRLHLERNIRAPYRLLRETWLPTLFLLFYVLCWLGRALWKLLGPEQTAADHPDVDRAWEEGLAGLTEAGLGLTEAPLFLVLGRPAGSERALFNAGGLKLAVKQVPRRSDAPVAVSANAEAVFVTAPGASLLGRYAGLLHRLSDAEATAGFGGGNALDDPEEPDSAARATSSSGRDDDGGESVFVAESATATMVESRPVAPAASSVERSRSLLLRDPEEVERQLARLRHLCELIERDRRPYTPLNGILLVIPADAGASDAAAREVATLCQRDLDAVREQLQVECPVVALVCDVEQIPGFADFMTFFPEGQRKRFLGQQFPLVPDLDASGKVKMVERGVQWVANVQFPLLIYKNWEPEPIGLVETPPSASANVRLYRFLSELRERQRRIGRVLTRGVVMPTGGRAMLGACGFAATGRDIVREQGFGAGAFRFLVDNQNHVAWTPEAVEGDAAFRRLTRLGYLGLVVLVAALVVLGYLLWPTGL